MGSFEYVMVLVSIVVGLAITHVLTALAAAIHRVRGHEWSYGLYLFIIAYAIGLFMLASILVPRDLNGVSDSYEYFMAGRKRFFGTFPGPASPGCRGFVPQGHGLGVRGHRSLGAW